MTDKPEFSCDIVSCSTMPLRFDESKCIGCNRCADICQVDLLIPSTVKGQHPIVMYPGECYYCGACVMECPVDALHLRHPLMNRARFIPAADLTEVAHEVRA